jgi:transposase
MTKSYSLDLRRRVEHFVEAGHSCHEAARHFEISVAFVVRLMAAYRTTGSLAAKPDGGWRYSKLDPHRETVITPVPRPWPSASRTASATSSGWPARGR